MGRPGLVGAQPPLAAATDLADGGAGHYGSDSAVRRWSPPLSRLRGRAKNPAVSLLASFFIPGLGTMLNGEVGKGIGILVGYFACLFLFFLIVPLLVAVGLWVWGMVDAYQGAQQWNRRHGIQLTVTSRATGMTRPAFRA